MTLVYHRKRIRVILLDKFGEHSFPFMMLTIYLDVIDTDPTEYLSELSELPTHFIPQEIDKILYTFNYVDIELVSRIPNLGRIF